jgi:hypothetical protein
MAKANLDAARELYPSCKMGMEEWTAFFGTAPGLRAMGRILYDIYDELMSREEREQGKRRIGRRPARSAVPLADLMMVVRPEEFSNEPLPASLGKLLRGRSQRQFARKVPMDQGYLCRILSGERGADLELIERLAAAAGVQPWHFPEWRGQYLGALITEVLIESPHLGITAIKGVRATRQRVERLTG